MRQFLAAELPDGVRRRVTEARAGLEGRLRGWRWVRTAAIHLTLRFLGEVDEGADRRARAAWSRIAAGSEPFRLRLTKLGRFPARGGARVLWAGLEETEPGAALASLAARLESGARELGWEAELRPFRPHLTLARCRRGARPDEPPGGESLGDAGGWVRRIVLYQSHLERGGARYTALASFPLGDADESAGDGG
jgi:2'-5' RNA ligase